MSALAKRVANRGLRGRARLTTGWIAAAAAASLAAPTALAQVDLELRASVSDPIAPGTSFDVDLYAVGDGESFTAVEVILDWEPAFVQLTGIDNAATPFELFSGFNDDPYGINGPSLPSDGDGFYQGFIDFGDSPVVATAGGTFLVRFKFISVSSAITEVAILDTLAGAETAVISTPGPLGGVSNIAGELVGTGPITVFDCDPPGDDVLGPEITCPSGFLAKCDGASGATVDYDPPPTAEDLCDGDVSGSIVCDPPSGSVFPPGEHEVTCTASDSQGNTSSCTFTVLVLDNDPPSIVCPAVMTTCKGSGGATVDFDPPMVEDCDPDVMVTYSDENGDPLPSGSFFAVLGSPHTVTCTATDSAGNSATDTFTVTVTDTVAPVIACPASITGHPCGTPVMFTVTATDDCDDPDEPLVTCFIDEDDDDELDPGETIVESGDVLPAGTTTITCVATDAAGNADVCEFDVEVVDGDAPVLSCPDEVTAECTGAGGAVVTFDVSATDDCDGDVDVTCSMDSGDTFPVGTTTVDCTAEDDAGNMAMCSFDVIVEDTTPPAVTCSPDIVTGDCDSGGTEVTYLMPSATDDCSTPTFIGCSIDSGETFPVGTTTVTCTFVDDAGNFGMCAFDITVGDGTPPTLDPCPPDQTVECTGPDGAVVTYTEPDATDDCDPSPTVECVPASGSTFVVGDTVVTCTATDAAGNESTCTFTVTVEDTTDPTIDCPADMTVPCEGLGGAVVNYTPPTASDTCDDAVDVECVPAPGSSFPSGTTTVTCTAMDAAGNTAVCTFDITVEDDGDPMIDCPGGTIELTADENCQAALPDLTGLATASDLCDDALVLSQTPAVGALVSGTSNVTITATDGAGNTATCTITVEVVDETGPVITLNGANPLFVLVDTPFSDRGATADDNCDGDVSGDIDVSGSVDTSTPGTYILTYSVMDSSGNLSIETREVVVTTDAPPEIICPTEIKLVADDMCKAALPDLTGDVIVLGGGAVSIDLTDDAQPTGNQGASFRPDDDNGDPAPVVLTARTSIDEAAPFDPAAAGDPGTLKFKGDGVGVEDAAANGGDEIEGDGDDADEEVCFTFDSPIQADSVELGLNKYKPGNGLGDKDDPVIFVTLSGGGTVVFDEDDIDPAFTSTGGESGIVDFGLLGFDPSDRITKIALRETNDAIYALSLAFSTPPPTVMITQDPAEGTLVMDGDIVMITASTGVGGSTTCEVLVMVNDETAPDITCPPGQTLATDPGSCETTDRWDPATATDNCDPDPVVTYDIDIGADSTIDVFGVATNSFPLPLGIHLIFPQAADESGNSGGGCFFQITVTDGAPPVLDVPADVTLECGDAEDPGNTGQATADDVCDPDPTIEFEDEVTPGTCPIVRTITRTWTATDAAGNSTSGTQIITVQDTFPPLVTDCPADLTIAECDATTVTWDAPTVDDFCDDSPTLVYDIDLDDDGSIDATVATESFSFPTGAHLVIARATDACGNESTSCSFRVDVVGQVIEVTIELAGLGFTGTFQRCVQFEVAECPSGASIMFEEDVTFSGGLATVSLAVPCEDFTCISAIDPLHTLRERVGIFSGGGGTLEAFFTGASALRSGNLVNNDDCVIEITDFGAVIGEFGSGYPNPDNDPTLPTGANTPCTVTTRHADVDGDGLVAIFDLLVMSEFFLEACDPECCATMAATSVGRTEISIEQLHAEGLGDLAVADLNGDGMLDMLDVVEAMNGVRPVRAASYVGEDGGSWLDPANWSDGRVPDAYTDVTLERLVRVLDANAEARSIAIGDGGQLRLSDAGLSVTSLTVAAGGVLQVEGGSLLSVESMRLEADATLLWTGGTIEVRGGELELVDGDLIVSGIETPSVLRLLDGAAGLVGGDVAIGVAAGSFGSVELEAGSALLADGVISVGVAGTGTLTVAGGSVASGQLGLVGVLDTGDGEVLVTGPGSMWTSAAHVELGGAGRALVTVSEGAVLEAPVTTVGPRGVLNGDGAIWSDVVNDGDVQPLGLLRIDGAYTQSGGGTLTIQLGASRHDALEVGGAASLDGTIRLRPDPDDRPVPPDAFTIVSGQPIQGRFATVAGRASGNVRLTVGPRIVVIELVP